MRGSRRILSKKFGYPLFFLVGFFFVFCWKSEKDLIDQGNILWTGGYIARILGMSLLLGALIGGAAGFLLYGLAERSFQRKGRMGNALIARMNAWVESLGTGKVYFASLLLIVLSWFPVYLAYYPAICSYDAPIQVGQAVDNFLIDHHPLVHTLMIKGFINMGKAVFGDANGGIGVYAILQMVFLAAAFSYGIATLHRFGVKPLWQIAALLYSMFYPFHWYMSVTMTKDTIFTGFVLLMMVSLCRMLLEGRDALRADWTDVVCFLGVIGVVLFRNNGKYALLVLLFFLLLAFLRGRASRRLWGRLFANILGAFLLGNLILSAVFALSGAEQGDRREMLSMPIQQLARCMVYHGGAGVLPEDDGTMADEDRALINDFLLDGGYRYYNPYFADPVKSCTNTYVVRYRYRDFLNTYFHMLTQYTGDMINAGLAVNAGYLYPNDVTHARINETKGLVGRGYVQTYWFEPDLVPRGIYKDSKWESLREKLEEWADSNAYLKIPVLKYFFVPGSYLYLYLLLALWRLINGDDKLLLPLAFVLGYYVTLFLGPTVQLRYLYPVMVVLPFLALCLPTGKTCGQAVAEEDKERVR